MRTEISLTSDLRLNEEQRKWVRKALLDAGLLKTAETLATLVTDMEASMNSYQQILRPPLSPSQNRTILRKLLKLVEQPDPAIGQIRQRVQDLVPSTLAEPEERAARLALRLIKQELPAGGLKAWSQIAPAEELLMFLQAILVEGGVRISERQRAGGPRSRTLLKPIVLGTAEGARSPVRRWPGPTSVRLLSGNTNIVGNGRPARDDLGELISYLATDWRKATDQIPQSGRSDRTPFGSLVHHVFQWLKLPGATGALRRYCAEVDLDQLHREDARAKQHLAGQESSPTR